MSRIKIRESIFLILAVITSLFTTLRSAFADTPKIRAKVMLFPVGSFDVTSSELIGSGVKKAESFRADALRVPVKSLVTGMNLRDAHMRERLLEKEHAYVQATDIVAKDGAGSGLLTLAGVTKKFEFTYKIRDKNTAEVEFKIKLSDFNIKDINYKGVGVEDEVEVFVNAPYEVN